MVILLGILGLLMFTAHGQLLSASLLKLVLEFWVAVLRGGWILLPIAIILRFTME